VDRQLRALAVTTATRSPALPDVLSVADFVPGLEALAASIGWPLHRRDFASNISQSRRAQKTGAFTDLASPTVS
jgi:hypothetical protein